MADPLLSLPVSLWVAAGVNIALGLAARGLSWVDTPGAWTGAILGTAVLWGLGWPGFILFTVFVALGSVITRLGYARKQERGVAQENRGRRSWNHALANCGAAGGCALLARLTGDAPMWGHAFAASLAAALADTGGSELGALWGRRAFHPLTLRRLPTGSPGACSAAGTAGGALLAALFLGLGTALGLTTSPDLVLLWPAALAGAWLDSVAGAIPALRRGLRHDGRNALATLAPVILILLAES